MPRPLLTGCAAMAIAASALAMTGFGASGSRASAATAQSPGGVPPVSVAITSVTPQFARPGQTVTVSGTITNTSAQPVPGLSVQLRSSGTPLKNRDDLQEYADGTLLADQPVPGAAAAVDRTLAPRATADFSVGLPVNSVPMTVFGVYPLAVQAESASLTPLTVSRTFLPFWPGTKAGDPQTEQIAWIWPLIDQPRQAVCSGLLNNGLAGSLASGGRLRRLLQAGSRFAAIAHLTWAIDPALLANVNTMTRPYTVGDGHDAGCGHVAKPASQAAAAWLAQLKTATAGEDVFVTPYADADAAALTRYGMTADLTRAFTQGRAVASNLLNRNFSTPAPAGSTDLTGMAWPADGIANPSLLHSLASSDGVGTVVLDSSTMPPSPPQDYTPSAQTSAPDGTRTQMKVLVSDDTLTQILGSANSPSDSTATAFSVAQRFLAETAMIAAEQPNLARSVVVAPPRHWDPRADLANGLLEETVNAPWLQPVSLGQLAAAKNPSGVVTRQAPRAHSPAALGKPLLDQARRIEQQARLLMSVEQNPAPALSQAAAAVESAAWRGGGSAGRQGTALAQQIYAYLVGQEHQLKIVGVPRVTLGGLTGTLAVSISNGLRYAVNVKLQADSGSGLRVTGPPHAVVVPPGQQEIVKLSVRAATVGSTTLRLRLFSPQGASFPAQTSMTIQATKYGTLALVIIAGALAVLVLTAAARAFRRARRRRPGGTGTRQAEPGGGDAGPHGKAGPDRPGEPEEADNVVADGLATGPAGQPGHRASAHDPAEETDDYAWAPRRADRR
jgi:hypothetical protein